MTTDKQNKWLAEQVYWVEQERDDVGYHPAANERYFCDDSDKALGKFEVIAVEDNPINGMQAMVATMMEVCL
ncbi:hypothetical protein [Streptococcus ruminantium]|uniref:Uncharacterized protein n=1 Tax=Streptococcus ruminantium TaxID=1917441 RepID=A0A2Z5TNC6_9STRE|nr:hypothetical protein [Streptococcus ruminantium]BBA92799.1 hypothetical protein SR187_5970 [Streptococcus ruminantium]